MKTLIHFSSLLKGKFIIGLIIIMAIILSGEMVKGVTYTAVKSGNWNDPTTWGTAAYPVAGDIANIGSTYTVALTADAACLNLTLTGTTGTRLAIGTYTITLTGKLTGPSTSFTNDIITTSTGKLKFTGAARTVNGNWSNAYPTGWNCEVAIASGIATFSNSFLLADFTLTSGSATFGATVTFGNLTLSAGTLTLNANASCNNITLAGTSGTRLAIGATTLSVSGTLTGPASFTNTIISTSTGTLQFIGNSRALFGTWAANYSVAWNCEIKLTAGQVGSTPYSVKFKNLTLTSGDFQVGTISVTRDLRIDGGASDGSGDVTIAVGTHLTVTGNLGARTSSSSTYCGNINIDGQLTIQGYYLNGTVTVNNGGILEIKRIDPSSGLLSEPSPENFTYNSGSTLLYNPEGTEVYIYTGAETFQTALSSEGMSNIHNLNLINGANVYLGNSLICNDITTTGSSQLFVMPGFGLTSNGTATFSTPLHLQSTQENYKPIMATYINNGIVNGDITMELFYNTNNSSASGTGRGLYFSSPISNATSTIFNVASGVNILSYQDEINRVYVKINTNGTALDVSKGYILRSAVTNVFSFTGPPNSASAYTINPIPRDDYKHYYLLGNPYPAVINWDVIDTSNNISSTIWYRSCDDAGTMVPADTYNGASGYGTSNNGVAVDGSIPPMQSVWIQCASDGTGSLTIPNTARSHNWGNANFLKSKAKQSKEAFRLYIYSNNKRDESIIVQSESAENTFERWDSRKFFLNDPSVAEMYTLSPEKYKLAIQSVKPITKIDSIPIGINVGTVGTYKFVADLSGISQVNNIYLEDKLLNVKQNLFKNPEYSFTSEIVKDTTGSRFALLFYPVPNMVTSTPAAACSPETVDLTSSSITDGSTDGLTYTYWTDPNTTQVYSTPSHAETGTYYIKGTDAVGAYAISGPIVVTVNPSPTVLTTNPAEVTEPATVNLTAPEITLGSTENLSYTYWTDAGATISYNTPQTALAGNYFIKGTIASTGCYSIAGPVAVVINSNTSVVSYDNVNDITIYSSNKQLYIINCTPNTTFAIYDILGRQKYIGEIRSDKEVINCNYNSGIYIVKIINKGTVTSKKVYIR